MQQETAQVLALRVLGWLAADDEMFASFLNATGASVSDLRSRAEDVAFLGSILDFLLVNDEWVVSFCDSAGLAYTAPLAARASLPGGEAVHWT
ncbi:MAG: DUF3572 domain-containing protein [Tabrizicola sp.]|nr:DUF3572 domain-containing protein [Tabrizicola sp.]